MQSYFSERNQAMTFLLKFPNKASFVNKLKPNNVILLPGTKRYKFSYIYNIDYQSFWEYNRYKFSYIYNQDYNPSGNTKDINSLIFII